MAKIIVQNTEITVLSHDDKDYISLTDMANGKQSESRAADVIKNWIRTRYTIEFLGTWEMIHNPNFKVVEFDHFRMQAVYNPNFNPLEFEGVRNQSATQRDCRVPFICVTTGFNAAELTPQYPDFISARVYALHAAARWWYEYRNEVLLLNNV